MHAHRPLEHEVLLTFDDGYSDQYRYAFPLLRRYGDVATFFVNVGTIGTARHLSWQEVERMARAGMSIGCVAMLSAHLHASVLAYAYPSGAFDAQTIELEQQVGLLFGFTTDPRFQTDARSPYELTRRRIRSGMTPAAFATLLEPTHAYVSIPSSSP